MGSATIAPEPMPEPVSAPTFAPTPGRTPRRRELLAIFLAAVLLHAAVMGTMAFKARHAIALRDYPMLSDGSAYINNARRINHDGMPSAYDQRVFVGYPWVVAMAHRVGLPYGWGAMGIAIAANGLLCATAAAWLKDTRVGWAMAVLPPHWVLDTAAVMNESLMLLLCVEAMLALFRWRQPWGTLAASMLFGAAGMVRPMACFAVAGAIAALLQGRRRVQPAVLAVQTLCVLSLLFFGFTRHYWNPLDNARVYNADALAYNGQVFTYPLGSFVTYARTRGVLHPSYLYKLAYVIAAAGVSGLAVVRWRRVRTPLDAWAAVWWGTNFAFVLCIGSHWGVDIAQRSLLWAAPAGFWVMRDWLPTRWWTRTLWALACFPWVFITSQS